MIVMKFGGSSLESSEAVRRVCTIVKTHVPQHPVIVVSAIGKTTNQLLTIAELASRGHGYKARKTLSAVQDTHFRIADELVFGPNLHSLERSLRNAFRELHSIIHDLSEDGCFLSPELSDRVVSFGERLSSEIVAAALLQSRVPAVHLDAREFILTDDRHGSATPLLWETYARLRRSIPQIAADGVVVMGGFIGATDAGITTTLGRGGSDLSASLVGAGIGAEEIQIWTDVDGMLTCDPRVLKSVYRLRSLSFEEAAALAGAGAKVLHPDTIQPALRQRIPVIIRNSREPRNEGTCISSSSRCSADGVKALALKENLVILEITSKEYPTGAGLLSTIADLCFRKGIEPALLRASGEKVWLGLANNTSLDLLQLQLTGYLEVHLRTDAALITLVGASLDSCRTEVEKRVLKALKNTEAELLPCASDSLSLQVVVPQSDCKRSCDRIHSEFFSHVDTALFAPVAVEAPEPREVSDSVLAVARKKYALLSLNVSARKSTPSPHSLSPRHS